MTDFVIVIRDPIQQAQYYHGQPSLSVGQTAREALDNWKKNSGEAELYEYVGIISLDDALNSGFSGYRPHFDEWVTNFFLSWVAEPGNLIPLEIPKVELQEITGGRLHLSLEEMK